MKLATIAQLGEASGGGTNSAPMAERIRCLVTGGSGFLGQHIVRKLCGTGVYDVTIFDIRQPQDNAGLQDVRFVKGDITSADQTNEACKGIDIVFHAATAAPTGANALNNELMYRVNILGTRNVIEACVANKVGKLIYTSSASVVFDGRDLVDVDEFTTEYAKRPLDYYTSTKIEAEKLVLKANSRGGILAVCALRPSAMFGQGDTLFVPSIIDKAQKGKMKFLIGNGKNVMDFTYIENVAQAHIQASECLKLDSLLAGQAYFITNQDPKPFWGFLGDICEGLGYKKPSLKLPYLLILSIVMILEYLVYPILRLFKEFNTDFTVNRITLSVCNRSFSCEKARRHFNYIPKISMKEGLESTVRAFEHLRKKPEREANLPMKELKKS